jgi:hypothetical protein
MAIRVVTAKIQDGSFDSSDEPQFFFDILGFFE